jgi:hypothetical protein
MPVCRANTETGATGLEPATSGVTDRYGLNRRDRLAPGTTGYSRHFLTERTGCDQLRPATTRQGLCSRCVVEAFANQATELEQILGAGREERETGDTRHAEQGDAETSGRSRPADRLYKLRVLDHALVTPHRP